MKSHLPKVNIHLLNALRREKKVPARVIGELIGVKVKQVYEMEAGRSRIFADQLKAIADFHCRRVEDFYL